MLPNSLLGGLSVLLLAFPLLALLHRSAPGVVLHILAGAGLVRLACLSSHPAGRATVKRFWSEYGFVCVAMLAPLALNLASAVHAETLNDAFPVPLQRLALTGFVLLALYRVPFRTSTFFQCGGIVAAFSSSIILHLVSDGGAVRPTVQAQNLLNYTNFIVLLGVYALQMLGWPLSRYRWAERTLKILAVLAAIHAVLLSDSRGPLLSLAALLVIAALLGLHRMAMHRRVAGGIAMLLIVAGAALQSDALTTRLEGAWSTLRQSIPALASGESPKGSDASTRIRLSLWQASWLMFRQAPWVGDASRSFPDKLIALNQAGLVSDEATWKTPEQEAYTQPHNELANTLANRGILGGVALLLLYLAPLRCLLARRRQSNPPGRVAADMGIVTCAGAFLFGLTVSVFSSGWASGLYALLVAVFLSYSRGGETGRENRPDDRPLRIPGRVRQKVFKKIHRLGHGRDHRHNAYSWPYVKVARAATGRVERIQVFKHEVPTISIEQAFATGHRDIHIILSGGSVADIDYARLPAFHYMGVNGSIALLDRQDIRFDFYCVIDPSFARTQQAAMRRIVSLDLVFLLTPDILRSLLEYIPPHDIKCRLCIIEDISERFGLPRPTAAGLRAMQAQGKDIVVFDGQVPLGFSFDPDAGWFDADTVAYATLQAAVWGGAKRLYFHGLDIQGAESTPRFYESTGTRAPTRLEKNFKRLIEPSFRQAVPLLRARGIQVYNLSPVSALKPRVMPFIDWHAFCVKRQGATARLIPDGPPAPAARRSAGETPWRSSPGWNSRRSTPPGPR